MRSLSPKAFRHDRGTHGDQLALAKMRNARWVARAPNNLPTWSRPVCRVVTVPVGFDTSRGVVEPKGGSAGGLCLPRTSRDAVEAPETRDAAEAPEKGVTVAPDERWFPSHLREISKTECLELLASHRWAGWPTATI